MLPESPVTRECWTLSRAYDGNWCRDLYCCLISTHRSVFLSAIAHQFNATIKRKNTNRTPVEKRMLMLRSEHDNFQECFCTNCSNWNSRYELANCHILSVSVGIGAVLWEWSASRRPIATLSMWIRKRRRNADGQCQQRRYREIKTVSPVGTHQQAVGFQIP